MSYQQTYLYFQHWLAKSNLLLIQKHIRSIPDRKQEQKFIEQQLRLCSDKTIIHIYLFLTRMLSNEYFNRKTFLVIKVVRIVFIFYAFGSKIQPRGMRNYKKVKHTIVSDCYEHVF